MAAPTYGAAGTYFETLGGTSAAFAAPASVAANSLIVIVSFVDGGNSVNITLPSGFTHAEGSPVRLPGPSGAAMQTVVAWHRASGSESGPYTMTIDQTQYISGQAHRFGGVVTTGTPFDSPTNAAGTTSNVSTSPAVAITTAGADRLILHAATNWSAGTWTPPTGYTKRQQGGVGGDTLSDLAQAVAGSTGSLTATCSGASSHSQAWLGALIPVAAVASPSTWPRRRGPNYRR
jgi:hypothetical protein